MKALQLESNGEEFLKKGLFGGITTEMERNSIFEIKQEIRDSA